MNIARWRSASFSLTASFVSVMADKKVSLNVIREFVGHSEDSKEIEKIYLHVMQKGKHKIIINCEYLTTISGCIEKNIFDTSSNCISCFYNQYLNYSTRNKIRNHLRL